MPTHTRTVCLEFFGHAPGRGAQHRRDQGLHVRRAEAHAACSWPAWSTWTTATCEAVGYATKSKRGAPAQDGAARRHRRRRRRRGGACHLRGRAPRQQSRSGEGFVAVSPEARKKFWLDRSARPPSARHTNAFKINEDVVIPLPRMARVHRRHRAHQHRAVARATRSRCADELRGFFATAAAPGQAADDAELGDRLGRAAGRPAEPGSAGGRRYARALAVLADNRDTPLGEALPSWQAGFAPLRATSNARRSPAERSQFDLVRIAAMRTSWKTQVRAHLRRLFAGGAVRADPGRECDGDPQARAARAACGSRCTCTPATATCTPTSRSTPTTTRCCRRRTDAVAAHHGAWRAHLERRDLGRARHRHHQARVPDRRGARAPSPTTRQRVDPEGRFNKGKLHARGARDLTQRLHAQLQPDGTRVADHAAVATSAPSPTAIKDCLRCGKCKPVCATHVPRANLLYTPRNKILATSLLIEAFLYEEQTRRGVSHQVTGMSSRMWPTTARSVTSARSPAR